MSEINGIVDVTISRETQVVKRANFGTALLVYEVDDASPPFAGRTKEYASLAEMTADSITSGTYPYDAAQRIFQQNPSVDKIKIGLKFITTTPDADWTAALTAIRNFDQDWYGLTISSTTIADQEEASDWAETEKIIYFIESADSNILDSVATTDIAYYTSNLSYDRSAVFYHPTATSYFAHGALGERFPKDPGAGTWMFKTLTGVSPYALTSAERTNAITKKANIYTSRSGISMTEEGTTANEYIDIIRGVDWLESTIQVTIFQELVTVEKVSYTTAGITSIKNLLKSALDEGVRAGVISDDYLVTVPAIADISVIDKGNRLLPDVKFTATLQGAIHKVTINGIVTV